MDRNDLWAPLSWWEPVYREEVVEIDPKPDYSRYVTSSYPRPALAPGTPGTRVIRVLRGYHEYYTEPLPWEDPQLAS
jgi:hypothetical protein